MICKNCGTEIADKALICYRCGSATFEPRVRPPERKRRSQLPALIALIILVIAALFMGRAAEGETPRILSYVMLGLAAIFTAWWLFRRR
jgi:uncharacterized membrane protein YvbJ